MTTFTSRQEYNAAQQRSEELITKARLAGGFEKLSKEEADEFGNITASCEQYEIEVLKLYPLTGKSANPALLQLEEEIHLRRMKQKDMASFLGISTARLSNILNGKSPISFKLAIALHQKLGFDGNLILDNV